MGEVESRTSHFRKTQSTKILQAQEFDEVKNVELHHFLDACQNGNGQCSYMSLVDDMNCIHCSMVMGKSWVIPLKPVTTPRLKQTAAIVSSKYTKIQEIFKTNSKMVLGYIDDDTRRFQVFIGNCV